MLTFARLLHHQGSDMKTFGRAVNPLYAQVMRSNTALVNTWITALEHSTAPDPPLRALQTAAHLQLEIEGGSDEAIF